MRLFAILPTLLAIASAGAAETTTPLQEFSAQLGDRLHAAAKPDQTAVDAAVARAKQDGVAKLTDAELVLVRGSGAHVLWRRAVAEQQRRSGDAKSAADNDGIADHDAYYRPDAERSASPWRNTGDMMRNLNASATVCTLHAKHDDYGALTDDEVAALDAIRGDLREDVAAAVHAEVMRRPALRRAACLTMASELRASGQFDMAQRLEAEAATMGRIGLNIESVGWAAQDWQGTAALAAIEPDGLRGDMLFVGLGVERIAIEDQPVTAAIEVVGQVKLPVYVRGTGSGFWNAMAIGPTIAVRGGVTGDGDPLFGWDAGVQVDAILDDRIDLTVGLGAGQRVTTVASDIQPTITIGLITSF